MKRPVPFCSSLVRERHCPMPVAASPGRDRRSRLYGGYTLVEILVSTTLSLLLLGAVVQMFGDVGQGITDSRAMLEAADRLRVAQTRLQQDLAGVTVTMSPPRKPENNEGYFEFIEGPITQANASTYAVASDNNNAPDTTVGDFDDILMFTTRSTGRPFVGRCASTPSGTIQSDIAEVAWFVRGRTLYRRVLLVAPSATLPNNTNNYYTNYDISAHLQSTVPIANTLGDLTRRECRFAHPGNFPFDACEWLWTSQSRTMPTLPTLRECSALGWIPAVVAPINIPTLDFWSNDTTKRLSDQAFAASNLRIADDVILTNVIGFDVKAWDPNYFNLVTNVQGAYVDLGYDDVNYAPNIADRLSHRGHLKSRLAAIDNTRPRVYDTYSLSYESENTVVAGEAGRAMNGFDDPEIDASGGTTAADGVVDNIVYNGAANAGENMTAPPYPIPLRGIQVKIRVFEPDSRQVREVTVVQDFLPQ